MGPDEAQPFIGPQPFSREQRDRFFGRKRETADLASLVISHPIVFFYGQSGTGKTSLIHAGFIPLLADEEGFEIFPVARPGGRVNLLGAEQTTASPYVFSTLLTWSSAGQGSEPPDVTNLAEFLAKRTPEIDKYGEPRPRLLIFDQLEELFTDQVDVAQEQQEFFEQIGELLDASRFRITSRGEIASAPLAPTRVLLAMREEYIAALDNFAGLLPDRLRVRFRLERLREPAALEAVTGPLSLTSLSFAPGVAEQLVRDLREVRVEAGYGPDRVAINVLGEFVEPVQLQVVCERLVRDIPPGVSEITSEHLLHFGSVDATLATFYKDAVSFAAASAGVPRDDLERWCETLLITGTGTRSVVHRGPTHSAGMPNAALDALVSRFLLRLDQRAGAYWYELTHDRLIAPIQTARDERKRIEAEQREAEQVRRRRAAERRIRWLVAGLALVSVAAFTMAVLYYGAKRPECIGSLTCAWRFQTDGEVFARPAIAGSIAYVASIDGRVYAIDSSQPEQMFALVRNGASRHLVWRFPTGDQVWSSPALVDGILYVGSQDGNLYAIDAASGREIDAAAGPNAEASDEDRWPFPTSSPIVTSPAVVDGVVYFGSFDHNLYAVDAETGEELWRFPTGAPIVSSPTVVDDVIYFGSDDTFVYAVDSATRKVRWRFDTGERVRSTPAVIDGVVYVGSLDNNVYAIDAVTGKELWRFTTGERVRSSPSVVDGIVYVGSYDTIIYALDAGTGRVIWRFPTEDWVVASPLVHNGVVYVGSNDRRFYAINAASGQEIGRLVTDTVVQSFPTVLGDKIIFGSGGGSVYAINQVSTSDGGLTSLGTPVVSSGTPGAATPFASP